MVNVMIIIERIRELQNERGWTDYKLAQEANISQSTLATVFSRKTPPKFDVLKSLCDGFGITLSQFFLEDEQVEILSANEKKMINAFRNLSCDKQNALIVLIKNEL